MPYTSVDDLPESVRNSLPKHAQKIFQKAFNSAYEQYDSGSERRKKGDSRDVVAFKVAWSAVKKEYEKRNDRWVKKTA